MKIIIDTEHLLKERCPTKEALLLVGLYYNSFDTETITKAMLDGYLDFKDTKSSTECDKFVITREGIEKVESILLNSEIVEKVNNEDRYIVLANKLREVYPSGRKDGTAYQWRDSTSIIALRLKALVKKYPNCFDNVSDDKIIDATRRYVQSFNGNYTYMQLLKYFIMKNNLSDRAEDTSQLLAYLENDGQDNISNDIGELI